MPAYPAAQVDGTFLAERTSLRPIEHGANGQYRFSLVWSPGAGAGSGPIMSFRWGSAKVCVIRKLVLGCFQVAAGASASGLVAPQVFVARGFTASDTGGVSILPTGNFQKQRTSMATTLATDLRISTAGLLTAGTRTLDSIAFLSVPFFATTGTPTTAIPPLAVFDATGGGHPLVLAQNEGIVVNNTAALSANTSLEVTVEMEWAEVDSY